MNGHLGKQHSSVTLERRCRASGPHAYHSALWSGAQGAQRAPVAIFDGPTMSALRALHLAHS
jgi:hypothetical protein